MVTLPYSSSWGYRTMTNLLTIYAEFSQNALPDF